MALSSVRNINDLIGYIRPNEIEVLKEYASQTKDACVNIGTFQGKSAIAMALHNDDVTTIDAYDYELYDEYVKEFNVKINKVIEQARDVIWKKPIGLLFIDGSHRYEDIVGDYQNFNEHVVVGGVIIFHDYNAFDVPKALDTLKDEIAQRYHTEKTVGDMLCLRKIK